MSSERRSIRWASAAALVAIAVLLGRGEPARGEQQEPADLSLDLFTDKLNGFVGEKIDGHIAAIDAELAGNPANREELERRRADLESLKVRLDDEKIVRAWWNALKSSKEAIAELAKEAENGYAAESDINIGFFATKNIKGLATWENTKGAWNSAEKYISALDGLRSDLEAVETSGLSPASKKLAGSITALTRVMSTFGDKVPLIGDFIALYGNVGGDVLKAAMALDQKIEAAEGGEILEAGMHGDRIAMSDKLVEQGLGRASRVHGFRNLYESDKGPALWDEAGRQWVVVNDHEPGVTIEELTRRYLYYAKQGNKSPSPEQLLRGYQKTVVLTLTPSKTNILPGETIDLVVGGHMLHDEKKVPVTLDVEVKLAGSSAYGGQGTFASTEPIKIGGKVAWTAPDNVNEKFDFTADLAKHVIDSDVARSAGPARAQVRTGAGTKIELVARPDTAPFGGEVALTAKVFTIDGQPLDAKASGYLDFQVTARPGTMGGGFGNYQELTEQKGASQVWSAPEEAGRYEITVTYSGATSGVFFPSHTAGCSAKVAVAVEPPRFSVAADPMVMDAKKDAPAEFAVAVKNEQPAGSGQLRFNLRAQWAPAGQAAYWRKSLSETVFWLDPGAEQQVKVVMAPTDEEKATSYKVKLWVTPRGTKEAQAKTVVLTAVHAKAEKEVKVKITSTAKDGKASAGGGAERMAKVGDAISLSFRPWGARRKYCTVDVVEKNKNMKQVVLHSHGPDGCDFGTDDGRLSTSWKVTEETVTWSGPVKAGKPSHSATFQVPAEPGTYSVSATGTVKWHQESKRPGGNVSNDETETGSGSFTIVVEAPK
jgi:hypothetical protein